MGSEGEFSYSWLMDGNTVEVQIGMEDGRVKGADLITATDRQYWLARVK